MESGPLESRPIRKKKKKEPDQSETASDPLAALQDQVGALERALEDWKAEVEERLKAGEAKWMDVVDLTQVNLKVDLTQDSGGEQLGDEEEMAQDSGGEQAGEEEVVSSPEQVGDDAALSYKMESSVWTVSLFVGLPSLGWCSSIVLVLLIFMNIFGQAIFVLAIFYTKGLFIQNNLPDQKTVQHWRLTEGHALANVFSSASLTQRVCSGDESLSVASSQADLVAAASAYEGSFQLFGCSYGVILTMFVIMLWFLVACKELSQVQESLAAVSQIPKGRHTVVARSGDRIVFKTLSRHRFAWVIIVSLIRLLTVSVLLIAGCRWLGKTVNLEDLVLNGAALAFVLDFDELLFEALAPHRLKMIMDQMDGLPFPKIKATGVLQGIGAKAIGIFFTGLILMVCVYQSSVWKTMTTLQELNATLCANDTNFAYAVHPVLQNLFMAPTVHGGEDEEAAIQRDRERLIKTYAHRNRDKEQEDRFMNSGYHIFAELSEMSFWSSQTAEAYYADKACDNDDNVTALYKHQLQVLTKDTSLRTCRDVKPYCNNNGMDMIRALCPLVCMCNSLLQGPLNRQGCLPSCRVDWQYQIELALIECRDHTREEILSTSSGQLLSDMWGVDDCQYVAAEMCLPPEEMLYGTYLYLCPIACGCAGLDKKPAPWCPPQCDSWEPGESDFSGGKNESEPDKGK